QRAHTSLPARGVPPGRVDPEGAGRRAGLEPIAMAEPIAAPKSLRAYGETLPPDPSTPWREADFCVVDIETTGLDPAEHEIISFAALHIASGRLHLDDPLYQLVRPRRMPGRQTIVIHGLRNAELVDAPSFAEALGGLLEALTGRAMVAHVAS